METAGSPKFPGNPRDHSPCSPTPVGPGRLSRPWVSCLARPPRLTTTRAHHEEISGLNRTAFDLAVYASQGWSPTHHARLASGCWSGSTGRDWLPAGFHLKGFKLPSILLSRASWRDVSSFFNAAVIGVSSFFNEKRTDTNNLEPCDVSG